MTSDERNMLTDLANKFAQTPAPPKDPEAEDFIRTRIGSRPDALYMMTQTVLIQNLALQHAQEQIQQLQRGVTAPGSSAGGSFLGGSGAGQQNPSYSRPASQSTFAPPPSPAPQYAPAPQASGSNPGGAPSFLRGAAQTAAGVAAGALAFEGIQSLFSHPGYGGAGLGGFGGGGFGGGGSETIVNNYYDNPSDTGNFSGGDDRGQDFADSDVSNVDDSGQYDDGGGTDFSDVDDGGSFGDSGDNFS